MNNSTIAAIATPGGRGGIGIIKISGPKAVSIAASIFSPAKSQSTSNPGNTKRIFPKEMSRADLKSHRLYLGHIIDPGNRRIVDEVLLCVMKSPRSYTKEDVVEINAHGGRVAVNLILELVLRQGATIAEPGEFTKRAFLNGRIDLTQAEAVIDLINARTEKSLQVSAAHIEGDLRKPVEQIREFLIELLARVEASIDFPDDVTETIDSKTIVSEIKAGILQPLEILIQDHVEGNLLRDGMKVSVVGRPNVGKSSLLNRLIQKDRALVTSVPGTTRDTIEETLNIKGFPVVLADTAGLHNTNDPIETLSMEKTMEKIKIADMVIFIIEADRSLTSEDYKIFEQIQSKPFIIAVNKIDLLNGEDPVEVPELWKKNGSVEISALYDRGINRLKEQIILTGFGKNPIDIESAIVPNLRQKLLLEDCFKASDAVNCGLENGTPMDLIAIHIQDAVDSLGEILGTNVKLDVLDQIFSRFCIGK